MRPREDSDGGGYMLLAKVVQAAYSMYLTKKKSKYQQTKKKAYHETFVERLAQRFEPCAFARATFQVVSRKVCVDAALIAVCGPKPTA